MTMVGSYQAKNHLPQLLDRVAKGECILITRHGRAVAMLVPAKVKKGPGVRGTLRKLRALRQGVTLGPDFAIKQLIEEGRRL
jgi:prevent-host-death family protein